MRDPARIEKVLGLLRQVWHTVPDQRLGQLLMNLRRVPDTSDLWHTEDEEWMARMQHYLATGEWQ